MLLKCSRNLVLPGMLDTNSTDTQVHALCSPGRLELNGRNMAASDASQALAVKWDHDVTVFYVCETSGFNLLRRLPVTLKEGCRSSPYHWL